MVRRLSLADADCAVAFAELIAAKRDSDADVGEAAERADRRRDVSRIQRCVSGER